MSLGTEPETTFISKLKDSWMEFGERFRRRSPLARIAFGGLFGFAVSAPFSISLAQICVFTAMVTWLVSMSKGTPLLTEKFPLWRPWLLFAILTLASSFHAADSIQSLIKARELTQIMIFYLAVNVIEDDWEALWLVKALFIATSITALYTLGISLQLPLSLNNRMSGFFSIYMTLGGFLLVVGTLALSYILVPTRERKSIWIYASTLLIVTALMTTLSRNAWVGLAVGLVVVAVASKSRRAGLCLALLIALVIFMAPHSISQRVKSMMNLQDKTAVERMYMWKSGVQMLREKTLLGFGPGQIKNNYARYVNPKAIEKSVVNLHNNVVHLAAERGILALGAWVWAWIGYFILVLQRIRDTRAAPFGTRLRMVGGLAVAAGFLSAGMFEYNFGDSEVVMVMFVAIALPFMGRMKEVHPG